MLKKYFTGMIIVILLTLVSGCGNNNDNKQVDSNGAESTETVEKFCAIDDDDCWWDQMEMTLDESLCVYLSTTSQESKCFSYVKRKKYEKNNDFNKCASLSNLEQRDLCYTNILNNNDKGFCATVKQKQLCEDYYAWHNAKKIEDCDIIKRKDWQRECLEVFGSTAAHYDGLDLDNDGLSNLQEKKLGTNLKKADTDGDGYTDGEEVEAGHDPLNVNEF